MKHQCKNCGDPFVSNHSIAKYCTHKCFTDTRRGKKRPEHSKLMTGSGNSRWKGGLIYDKDGYLRKYSPDHPLKTTTGYVLEHRLVAEGILGRLLKPMEDIHHINGVKDDNRPENLTLLSRSDHARLHHYATKDTMNMKLAPLSRGVIEVTVEPVVKN